jgi:TetR/AcrR family transcriptional regulator, cholesterol catabolism regulator
LELKDRILHKAQELFSKFGIRAVTMDEISTQIGISKKTLYQYYSDKDGLVDECMEMDMVNSKSDCSIATEMSENAVDEIFITLEFISQEFKDLNPIIMHDLKKFYPQTYEKFNDHINSFYYNIIYNNLEKGIQEGLYRDNLDLDIITKFRLSSIVLGFDQNIFPSSEYNLLKVTEKILEHFLYGIVTEKGLKLIYEYKSRYHKHA